MSDYYYLHSLNQQCRATGRATLPEDIYITPCDGTKLVGHLAALFLGQDVRPLILLDGDDAGRVRRDALLRELYAGQGSHIVMLDDTLGSPGSEVEIDDILGEAIILPALNAILPKPLSMSATDRKAGSMPSQIKAAAKRQELDLPEGWKATVALGLVSSWAQKGVMLPDVVLDAAAKLFVELRSRFTTTSHLARAA